MQIELAPLLEWQRQAHELIDTAFHEGKRLIMINCGRRSGKSDMLTKWAIVWERGILAGGSIGYCAPSEDHYSLPKRWIKNWLGSMIIGPAPGGNGYDFCTGGRIQFFSLGAGAVAPLRGFEFQAVIIDEAAFLKDNLIGLLESNIWPCLALSSGPVVIGSSPQGVGNDYHSLWQRAGREGARMSGPSTMNPAYTLRQLELDRQALPELRFRQEFLGEFVDQVGAVMRRSDIRVGKAPPVEEMLSLVMGVDFALKAHEKADFTGVTIAGVSRDKMIWILYVTQFRSDWPQTLETTLGLFNNWRPTLFFTEEVAFQNVVVHQLADRGVPIWPLKSKESKSERFGLVHCQYKLGRIMHADNLSDEFTNQLLGFPEVQHDDMVDSLTCAIAGLTREIRQAWSANESSGYQWSTPLGHEKRKKLLYGKDGATFDMEAFLALGKTETKE